MSTVLSYNSEEFRVLMSDTRVVKNENVSDDCLKIHYLKGTGFITGVGIGDLAQRTFQNILKYGDFQHSFYIAYKSIEDELEDNGDELNILKNSVVIIVNSQQVFVLSKRFEECCKTSIVTLKPNVINIQYPLDISDKIKSEINETLKLTGIEEVILHMLKCFKKISESSNVVSNICSIVILKGEKTIFIQNKVEEVIEQIEQSCFDALENEFDKYEAKLSVWDTI